jgi:two-component system LytT family response regulator
MRNALRAIIVDDEIHARENLKFLIDEHCPEISVVGLADGVESAEHLFHRLKPNVIFLDIRMPSGAEGFDLLERLDGKKFKVIFVTAFKDYAIRAFERRALHYILKPIDEMDLRETVARLTENFDEADHDDDLVDLKEEINENAEPVRLTIHHSKGIRIVEIGTITYLESSGNCTVLHFRDGSEYLDTRTLKIYEAILPSYFHRVHRSYIVNLRETAEILHGNDQSVVLKTGDRVPVARERKRELLEAINSIS